MWVRRLLVILGGFGVVCPSHRVCLAIVPSGIEIFILIVFGIFPIDEIRTQ
jgi:hypothetical protein